MNPESPSFLTQTGPNTYTLTLSASGANTLQLCPAKYSWAYVTGIEAVSPRAGQNYGTSLHLPLAHRYRNWNKSLAAVESEGSEIIERHFAEHPQPEMGSKGRPEWRTAMRAQQAWRAYNERYPAEDFEVLGVEEPFEVELGGFSTPLREPTSYGEAIDSVSLTVKFRGIRDLRVRWHDSLWVVDHKTSTEWSDLSVDEGKCSFQFMGYAWVERLATRVPFGQDETPVGGVIGNYLISRQPYSEGRKVTARDLPRDQFERVPYPYSDAQLDEWHARAMGVAKDLWRHWSEGEWPQRSTACAHWGRCEYYQLCWETDPAYRMAAALGGDYRQRTPSPFEEAAGKERD